MQQRMTERLNWADCAYVALIVPRLGLDLLLRAVTRTQAAAVEKSFLIDTRKRFARQVLMDIVSLPEGDPDE